jgi:hypothetical protein
MPWMASAKHILVLWIPAIPAGKTLLLKHPYSQVKLFQKAHMAGIQVVDGTQQQHIT